MIYVGAVLGGPELGESSHFMRSIRGIHFPSPGKAWYDPTDYGDRRDPRPVGSLDIVFHVPGSVLKPEHEGLRTGRFSRKERMLQVQIAVPGELMESLALTGFLVQSIREAIVLAERRFAKAGITYPVDEYLGQVDELERQLGITGIQ